MQEQRRHQRIRFGTPLMVRIGFDNHLENGTLENLSLSGFMVRTSIPLQIGRPFGCEFAISGSVRIDTVAITVSRLGDLYGARFQAGPIIDLLVKNAMEDALAEGHASCVTTHFVQNRKIMCVAGGLNATLENDFSYGLTKAGITELDLSAVSCVDRDGIELCKKAMRNHGATICAQSRCFELAWKSWA